MKSLCLRASVLITTLLLAANLFADQSETIKKLYQIDKYHQEMKFADTRLDLSEMMTRTNKLVDYCKRVRFTPEEIESVKKTTGFDPEEYRKDYVRWLELRQAALLAMFQLYIHETEGRASEEDAAKVKAKVKLWSDSEKSFNLKYHK